MDRIFCIDQGKQSRISILMTDTEDDRIQRCIDEHPFNRSLLTISDKEINKKEYFYYEISCPLSYFISNEFIELLNDSAYVLSSNARIDTDCVFAVVSGKLILNVNQDLYQRLGLTGTKSLINPTRRIITIDLNEKISDRITWCFSNTCTEAFTFYISSWDTIAKKSRDIIFPSFVQSIRKELSYESKLLKECLVPDMDTVIEDDNQRIMDYMEWIGMAGIHSPRYTLLTRLKKGHTVDPFICLYTLPEPHTYANIQVSKFKGFLIPEFISLLKSENIVKVMAVNGYPHSCISWKNLEHGYSNSGENDYVIAILSSKTIVYQTICNVDKYNGIL